ncbi:PREDICTED: toll-like receptor 13 [Nanorana parkeri]|uniref:toll-like receptor 13 n=1 Tax=Nanorana parkeri TaxID=125878 RepID=UPI00085509F0|nr:PREDICTED: toll-like receptor 13 [Nanorana parkeri]
MDSFSMMVALVIYLISGGSFCLCLLKQKCQVLEKKYFAPFLDLKFKKCDEFEKLDFTVAVHCDMVDNISKTLKEIPVETDWLCLTLYQGVAVQAEAFSKLKSLKALSISGCVEFLPGAFTGLSQLSVLWIESETFRVDITFHEDTFRGLNSLQELKLSGIDFSSFSFAIFNHSLFNHLPQLDHLILKNNNVTHLSKLTTSLGRSRNLPNLRKLSVIDNLQNLTEEDCFKSPYPGTDGQIAQYVDFNISFLYLSDNQFIQIDNNSLCNFPHLEVFQSIKSFHDIEQIIKLGIKTSKIISLPLFENETIAICKCALQLKVAELWVIGACLEEIDTFTGSCETLRNLDLSYNFIKRISFMQFQSLSNLLSLNLSNNALENLNICKDEFTPRMQLVYLNVSNNRLTRLYKGQFACLGNLQILSLEKNNINIIEDLALDGLSHLGVLNLQYNTLFTISNVTFANLLSLTHLNLYGNMIYEHGAVFKDLEKLQELMMTYDVDDYYYWFNYLHLPLIHLMADTKYMILENEFYSGFSQLEVLEMEVLKIMSNCSSQYVFRSVKELYLENVVNYDCFLPETHPLLTFINLERFHYIGNPDVFSDTTLNSLKDVPLKFLYLQDTDRLLKYGQVNVYKMFQGLSQLKVLHLQNSGINNLDSKDMFMDLRQLEFLVIENQDIEQVNEAAFDSMPNLKYIYFVQTTFPCNCKFKGLLSWLESGTKVSIINFHNQSCQINQNTSNLVSFLHSNCHTDLDLIMFAVTFVFTLLFMFISFCYENIWWYILYLVYTVKCWLNHRHQEGEHYEYDVFVSYNAHNELWVTENLLPCLEQTGPPFFRVCIHNRDFEVGKDIVENIMDSIYSSRWTVCVISRTYLLSNWCSLEMRMATYRLFAESKDSLILVFLDGISREELQHYNRLTKLLDKKTYLDWPGDEKGQQLFWARLRKVIAKSGRKTSLKRY